MAGKKLSIITINYNNAFGLEKTIESVVNQTFQDYEYIVIDGGSSDSSVRVIKDHLTEISYWVSEKDNGIYNAMNKGILKAKSEYCLFLNSGDTLVSEDILTRIFDHRFEEDIIYCNAIFMREGKAIGEYKLPEKLSLYFMLFNSICHQATFVRRMLLIQTGLYNESNKIVSDWEFVFRRVYKGDATFRHIPIALCNYEFEGLWNTNPEKTALEKQSVIDSILPQVVQNDFRDFHRAEKDGLVGLTNGVRGAVSKRVVTLFIKAVVGAGRLLTW